MTAEQAQNTVAAAASQAGDGITLTLTYEDIEKSMDCSALELDVEQGVQAARRMGHENFFTAGPSLWATCWACPARWTSLLRRNS